MKLAIDSRGSEVRQLQLRLNRDKSLDRTTGTRSGNHVGFFLKQTAGWVELLGGNQGAGVVSERRFSLSTWDIKGCLWPKDEGRVAGNAYTLE